MIEQLVYISRAASPDGCEADVLDILAQSRRHNPANNITGALAVTSTHFVQILEGTPGSLDVLLLKLLLDDRHVDIEVLDRAPVTERAFGQWAMVAPAMPPESHRRLALLVESGCRSAAAYRTLLLDHCATGPR